MTAFYRAVQQAARKFDQAAWVLIDVGPNLGAINRAALIASQHVVDPARSGSLLACRGCATSDRRCATWRRESGPDLLAKNPDPGIGMPGGKIELLGYVVMQHGLRGKPAAEGVPALDRPLPGRISRVRARRVSEPVPKCGGRPLLPGDAQALPQPDADGDGGAQAGVRAQDPPMGPSVAHGQAVASAAEDFLQLAQRSPNDWVRRSARPAARMLHPGRGPPRPGSCGGP